MQELRLRNILTPLFQRLNFNHFNPHWEGREKSVNGLVEKIKTHSKHYNASTAFLMVFL